MLILLHLSWVILTNNFPYDMEYSFFNNYYLFSPNHNAWTSSNLIVFDYTQIQVYIIHKYFYGHHSLQLMYKSVLSINKIIIININSKNNYNNNNNKWNENTYEGYSTRPTTESQIKQQQMEWLRHYTWHECWARGDSSPRQRETFSIYSLRSVSGRTFYRDLLIGTCKSNMWRYGAIWFG